MLDWSELVDIKAIVLLSGGLDSAVAASEAIELHHGDSLAVGAVSFTYGQKHSDEVLAAYNVAMQLGLAFHRVIDMPDVFGGGDSVLIAENELDMPSVSYEEINEAGGVSPTYVPFRNANLLSMATSIALTEGAEEVWAGMHAEDAHNWAYPDCTPEFLGAMANAIYVGSYHKVRLVVPHLNRTKAEIVDLGYKLGTPLHLTMSCYEGTVPACGTCPTCVGRIQAFASGGWEDPIEYAIDIDWNEVAHG
jgi:7-cyano-7-deazaguanine synthase